MENISAGKTILGKIILSLPSREAKMLEAMIQKISNDYEENCYEKDLAQTIADKLRTAN